MKNVNYEYCKQLARQVLSDRGVAAFPVDVATICRRYGMAVKTYEPKNSNPGQAFLQGGRPVIAVSAREPLARQRFICAHEFGHILMGHVGEWAFADDTRELPKRVKERAAMVFAAELLVPQCALAALHIENVEQIQKLFGVPYAAAFIALKEWQRRKSDLTEGEHRLIEQFGLAL